MTPGLSILISPTPFCLIHPGGHLDMIFLLSFGINFRLLSTNPPPPGRRLGNEGHFFD